MYICLIISVPIPPREGIGYHVWNLTGQLQSRGHRVQIITRGERGKPTYEIQGGVPIWRPRFIPAYPLHVHLHGWFVQAVVRRLERKVDLFHLHSPLAPPIRTHRPVVATVHTSRMTAARQIQITGIGPLLNWLQAPVSARVERRVIESAAQVLTVAQSVASELTRDYGVAHERITVVGNGVDTDLFHPNGASPPPPDGGYVLAAGRLAPRKGFEDLIQAHAQVVRQFPGVRLHIAGDGPLKEQLKATAKRLSVADSVRLLGHVERQTDVAALYRGAVLFAHAAHYEGLPTVLLEAMACGRPVIATAVSGALEAITPGADGLLTPVGDAAQLAEAICRLLGNVDLRRRLGRAARQTVERRFSWQVVGDNYVRSYRRAQKGRGGPR